ncbi:hypothetical protein THRCLA_20094 [Thraustotheca clavata]|uniref:DDE Tnp4 domain-containing protein n=1 Tax=Thraustotheca clavata TaxID=74557 RepID=A0A1W0ABK0_9STRA|nr:hypothetical protein THRCLA_20094 [Thraustotheca clavata]
MRDDEAKFNLLHSRTRIVVEQAFGLWKGKFRIFKQTLQMKSPQKMAMVIEATMVLHNWIIDYESSPMAPNASEWMHYTGDIVFNSEMNEVCNVDASQLKDNTKQYLNLHVQVRD